LLVTPGRLALSVVLLLVAAVLGCAFSLRRVLRIDPASAIGTTS
jgi:putative ABC transport system permease protein